MLYDKIQEPPSSYNPYAKGRWYRVFMESDGTDQTITSMDIAVTLSGNNLKMPEGFHIIDYKYDIDTIEHDAAVGMALGLTSYADGCQGITGPAPKAFDWAYVYIFGYYA